MYFSKIPYKDDFRKDNTRQILSIFQTLLKNGLFLHVFKKLLFCNTFTHIAYLMTILGQGAPLTVNFLQSYVIFPIYNKLLIIIVILPLHHQHKRICYTTAELSKTYVTMHMWIQLFPAIILKDICLVLKNYIERKISKFGIFF